jgi:hypothetical protein
MHGLVARICTALPFALSVLLRIALEEGAGKHSCPLTSINMLGFGTLPITVIFVVFTSLAL